MSWRRALRFQVAASAPFLPRSPPIKHDFTMTEDKGEMTVFVALPERGHGSDRVYARRLTRKRWRGDESL